MRVGASFRAYDGCHEGRAGGGRASSAAAAAPSQHSRASTPGMGWIDPSECLLRLGVGSTPSAAAPPRSHRPSLPWRRPPLLAPCPPLPSPPLLPPLARAQPAGAVCAGSDTSQCRKLSERSGVAVVGRPRGLPQRAPALALAQVSDHLLLYRQQGAGGGGDRPPLSWRPLPQVPPERCQRMW